MMQRFLSLFIGLSFLLFTSACQELLPGGSQDPYGYGNGGYSNPPQQGQQTTYPYGQQGQAQAPQYPYPAQQHVPYNSPFQGGGYGAGSTDTYSAPPAPPSSSAGGSSYTVKKGDTLWRISKDHGTTVKKIMDANSLESTVIKAGQSLIIP